MKRWTIWLSIITAVALGGCATVDTAAIQSQTKGKRIVVSSTVNSTLSLVWVGTTAFNVEKQALEKPEWQLPGTFEQHLVKQLQASDRFAAVELSTEKSTDRNQMLKTPISEADFVLFLSNGSIVDPLYSTNQMLNGFGVYQRTAFRDQDAFFAACGDQGRAGGPPFWQNDRGSSATTASFANQRPLFGRRRFHHC